MQVKSIPPQIVVKLAACVLTLALLVMAILLPQQGAIKGLRSDIAKAQADVLRQNALLPTYVQLQTQVLKGLPKAIPPLRELHLTKDRITDIQDIFRQAAETRGVFPESITPDPSSLAENGDALSVHCIFHGRFDALRGLLLDLGAVSSLRTVENITVREEGQEAMMQLTAWLTLE